MSYKITPHGGFVNPSDAKKLDFFVNTPGGGGKCAVFSPGPVRLTGKIRRKTVA
jgi:hypothetical protein